MKVMNAECGMRNAESRTPNPGTLTPIPHSAFRIPHCEGAAVPVKVLLVGQTPPPYHGQALSIQRILEGRYTRVRFYHVRMAFSREIGDVGRFRFGKVLHLAGVILRIIYLRFRYGTPVLHYPPAGPNRVPMYRDLAILISTRWLFRRTLFYFHASGLMQLYAGLSPVLRWLFRRAYFRPDIAVLPSEFNPADGAFLRARRTIVIHHGIADEYPRFRRPSTGTEACATGGAGLCACRPTILFVGVLRDSKGVMVLLEACRGLKAAGRSFKAQLMGEFESEAFRRRAVEFVEAQGLRDTVEFLGVLTGDRKWSVYAAADVFCFPSYFESESFGLAVLEAMQFELPVVATNWRGLASLVVDGDTGFLVPIKDSAAVAEKVGVLLSDRALREALGRRGRQRYLEHFTVERFRADVEAAFCTLAAGRPKHSQDFRSLQDFGSPPVEVVNILGVPIAAVNIPSAVAQIDRWIEADARTFVAATPVHAIMDAQDDAAMKRALNTAGMCVPDGMPTAWIGRFLGHRAMRRVYGPDLMLAVLERSVARGYTHFLYGGREGVAEALKVHLEARVPGLKVLGTFTPPFRPETHDEERRLADLIAALAPDILWVGLGAPKQEKWMAAHCGRLNAKVMVGVGAAFDFHTGRLRQAPHWMQQVSLEWLFRLAVEPRRLWRRYVVNNPRFLGLLFCQMLGLKDFTIDAKGRRGWVNCGARR